jgi:hypothetical protein
MGGFPDLLKRSGRRSRVRATYAVSLGLRPPFAAQRWKWRTALETLLRFAVTARSR